MFDFFGTEQKIREMREARERRRQLRDMAFDTVLSGNNYLRKIGVMSEEEYWKWRLPFDMERYGITRGE